MNRIRSAITAVALAVVLSGVLAGSAFGWTTATRLTTASAANRGALAVGAFAQPDGSFLVSGWTDSFFTTAQSGFSVGRAGGAFSAPSGPLASDAVWLPGGSSLIGTNGNVQLRAADGSLSGSPQSVAASGLGVDSSGNATAAGVVDNGSYQLIVSTRPAAGPSFTAAAPVATSGSPMSMIGLTVDPNGAAVVTYLVGTTLSQATRPAGAANAFGAPTTLAANAIGAESMASDAAGAAVLVYYDGSGYSAANRALGGAFAAPVDITGPVNTSIVPYSASAVASDGSAATLVEDGAASGCGTVFGVQAYRLAAGSTTWSAAGSFGDAQGNSIGLPALAGGGPGVFDAAWTVDLRTADQVCTGVDDPYQIQAGTLGGTMTPILTVTPPPLSGSTYGNAHTAEFPIAMALNSCGDGALIVGVADSPNSDLHNGLFTSTTQACPAATATVPGAPTGATAVAGHGAATVSFTAPPANGSPIIGYTVTASPGGAHATGTGGPITVVGLTSGTKYTFTVTATNAIGTSAASAPSNAVTPTALAAPLVHVGKIAAHGTKVVVKLSCPSGTAACAAATVQVTVTLHYKGSKVIGVTARKRKSHTKQVVIASARVSLKAGASKTLTLTLNGAGRSLHKKHHRLRASVRVTSAGAKLTVATVVLH